MEIPVLRSPNGRRQDHFAKPFQNGRKETPSLTYGVADCAFLMNGSLLAFPVKTLEVNIALAPALTVATTLRLNKCS